MRRNETAFVRTVKAFYAREGRHTLPWRLTKKPYEILVSEVMLHQTQVPRVLEKYRTFLKRFPTVAALAAAPLGDVLRVWQGLGYNRRAKMLHNAAKEVVATHSGKFPRTEEALIALPGIGHYTAGAILAFSFNTPVPIIETNIRTVFLHHFFKDDTDVSDEAILACVERTLDRKDPREWYYALMDYGAHLKKSVGNPNARSRHYTRQSAFKGSDREVRGAIIRALGNEGMTRVRLGKALKFELDRIDAQLLRLTQEGMITKHKRMYSLPT